MSSKGTNKRFRKIRNFRDLEMVKYKMRMDMRYDEHRLKDKAESFKNLFTLESLTYQVIQLVKNWWPSDEEEEETTSTAYEDQMEEEEEPSFWETAGRVAVSVAKAVAD